MNPLQVLDESELGRLTRVADRFFNTRQLLSPGHRANPQRSGSGMEFLDFREFSAGDDIKNIDWRASARSRHPQIRRYCETAAADWFIALDCSASMAVGDGKKWALATQCAAAMAYLLIHLGNRVGILLFSDRVKQMVPPGRGYTHYANVLQTLGHFNLPSSGGGSDLRSCVLHIKRFSPVIVISDFLAPGFMQNGLEYLSSRGGRLHSLQILSSWDSAIPTASGVRLTCVETGQSLTTRLNSLERERYRLAFNNFNDSLVEYCKKKRIHFSRHQSDEAWKSVLLSHFQGHNNRS